MELKCLSLFLAVFISVSTSLKLRTVWGAEEYTVPVVGTKGETLSIARNTKQALSPTEEYNLISERMSNSYKSGTVAKAEKAQANMYAFKTRATDGRELKGYVTIKLSGRAKEKTARYNFAAFTKDPNEYIGPDGSLGPMGDLASLRKIISDVKG